MAAASSYYDGIKRARTEGYTPLAEPVVATSAPSRTLSPMMACHDEMIRIILGYSSIETFINCSVTCRRFKAITEGSAMQRLFCDLFKIVSTPDKERNQRSLGTVISILTHCRSFYHGNTVESRRFYEGLNIRTRFYIGQVWATILPPTVFTQDRLAFLSNPAQNVMIYAKAIQKNLGSASELNHDLRQVILKSSPQATMLPFFLLSGTWGTPAELINIFQVCALTLKIALNRLDEATCALLANAYRNTPSGPDPKVLQGLFTDALIELPGSEKVTPAKVALFYNIDARPELRTLECLLEPSVQVVSRWQPNLVLFRTFLDYKAPLTTKVMKKILQKTNPSFFDLEFLENLLRRFIEENKMELPSTFLNAVINSKFPHDKVFDDRIELLLKLGCKPSPDTLIALRIKFRRDRVVTDKLADRFFSYSEKIRDDFILKCLTEPKLLRLLSNAEIREINKFRPTPEIAKTFYENLGRSSRSKLSVLKAVKEWLTVNGYPPTRESVLACLQEEVLSGRKIPLHPAKAIEVFEKAKTNRQIMLLYYFITVGYPETVTLEMLNKFAVPYNFAGLNTLQELEHPLKEFIEIFPVMKRLHVISYVLSILEKINYKPTPAALEIFSGIPGYLMHEDLIRWLFKSGLLVPLPAPSAAPLPLLRSLPSAPALPASP